MPDIFDQVETAPTQAAPSGDVFDQVSSNGPSPVMQRIGEGISHGLGMPTYDDVVNIWHHAANGNYNQAAQTLLGFVPGYGLAEGAVNHAKNAFDAYASKDYGRMLDEIGRMASGPFEPTRDAIDRIQSGDVAGGVAEGVSNLGLGWLMGKGMVPGEESPRVSSASNLPIRTPESVTVADTKPIIEQLTKNPKTAARLDPALQRALPLVKEQLGDRDLTPYELHQRVPAAVDSAMAENRAHYNLFLNDAEQRGFKSDMTPVSDAMKTVIPQTLQIEADRGDPDAQRALTELNRNAEIFNGLKLKPSEINAFIERNNALSKNLQESNASDKYAAVMKDTYKAQLQAQQKAMRQVEYNTIDAAGGGQTAQELQLRYGALKELKKFTDQMWGKYLVSPTKATRVGNALTGRQALHIFLEPSSEGKLADAINKFQGRLEPLPGPGGMRFVDQPLTSPEGRAQFQWQRELAPGSKEINSSAPDLRGLPPGPPGTLTRPGPAPVFNWQRDLFGDQ